MAEYLAPGVYVEETSFRSKSIEGVSTTTTAFIGPTSYGPTNMQPDVLTSLADFERVYGGGQMLEFEDRPMHNYMWHAVRAFFEEGGRRLYIARTFQPLSSPGPGLAANGRAFVRLPLKATSDADALLAQARFPGRAGNARAGFRLSFGGNVLAVGGNGSGPGSGVLRGLANHDIVLVSKLVQVPVPAGPIPAELVKLRDQLRALALTDPVQARRLAADAVAAARALADDKAEVARATADAHGELLDTVNYLEDQKTDLIAKVAVAQTAADGAEVLLTTRKAEQQQAEADQAALPATATQAEKDAAAARVLQATTATGVAQAARNSATGALVDAKAELKAIDEAPDKGRLQVAQAAATAAEPVASVAAEVSATAAQHLTEVAAALSEFVTTPTATYSGKLYRVAREASDKPWAFFDADDVQAFTQATLDPDPKTGDKVCIATVSVAVQTSPNLPPQQWTGLPLDPRHQVGGERDSLLVRMGERPGSIALARTLPVAIVAGSNLVDQNRGEPKVGGIRLAAMLFDEAVDVRNNAGFTEYPPKNIDSPMHPLAGGNDGGRPEVAAYAGEAEGRDDLITKSGLQLLEDVEDISIVAAPGVTWGMDSPVWRPKAQAVQGKLLGHCERMRYRIAVLDSGNAQSVADVRSMRAKIDSAHGHGALYYPWVRVMDPITRQELDLPPSGFVAGIYARNDSERAVYKAPANEVVRGSIGFEVMLNRAQQEVLNPEGINCFRFFEGRGYRLWGARTVSSDPEWKYVNIRRYFSYLERSIDKGTQWAVFEPNGEALWANVRRTIEDFLLNEWQGGALLGDRPEKSYFVRCDRSTMTQNDLDNGRLICLIGVAALTPAEFVIFRIGQWTADRRN